jgi:hypothetical protein
MMQKIRVCEPGEAWTLDGILSASGHLVSTTGMECDKCGRPLAPSRYSVIVEVDAQADFPPFASLICNACVHQGPVIGGVQ